MQGPRVWITLPKELWTEDMHRMRNPVVRLEKVLYGHKHSGVFWQQYCREQVEKANFVMISENWLCVFSNYKTSMLLVVYVDDMKLAGPADKMDQTWSELGQSIKLVVPKGDTIEKDLTKDRQMTFLGCTMTRGQRIINGKPVEYVEYNVEDSLKNAAVLFLTGKLPKSYMAETPFLEEEARKSSFRAPCDSHDTHFVECPSCRHTCSKRFADKACTLPVGKPRTVADFQKQTARLL
jgi:hypothetical protein